MDSRGTEVADHDPDRGQHGGDAGRSRWRLRWLQARWAFQAPLALARWLVGRVPLYRRNRAGVGGEVRLPDGARPLPGDPGSLQRVADGVGPLYNRRYWIDVTDTDLGPEDLIGAVAGRLSELTPGELARFEGNDDPGDVRLEVGRELVVRLPGPWDGPVRVVERTATSIRLATLRGHVEAGEIELRAGRTERGFLRFEIESWARSGNPVVHLLYDRFGLAREMQTQMWARLCTRVADLTGGVVMSNVQVQTERVEEP